MSILRAAQHHSVMSVISKPKPAPKPKKRNNPPMNKQEYLEHRKQHGWDFMCDSGELVLGTDMHHCFIGRRKGYRILDDYRNIVLVNHPLHTQRKFDNRSWRIYFWNLQCARYGTENMLEWVNAVPEKMRSRIDWLEAQG